MVEAVPSTKAVTGAVLAVAAVGLLYLTIWHRRRDRRAQLFASGHLYVEEEADASIRRRATFRDSMQELRLRGGGWRRFDGILGPQSKSVFCVRVPAAHRLHCEVKAGGHDLQLKWHTVPGVPDQRGSLTEPPLRVDLGPSGDARTVYLSLEHPRSSQAVRFSMSARVVSEDGQETTPDTGDAPPAHRLAQATSRVMSVLDVVQKLRGTTLKPLEKRHTPHPPSHRLLEARTHAHDARRWDEVTRGWHGMAEEAKVCREACRLWRDPDFGPAQGGCDPVADSHSSEDVRWLSLRELCGEPHRWPGGRKSYLYAYERHAAEVDDFSQPALPIQGSVGNCYLLSAVAATMGDRSVRRDLIDESLEDAGIYGVSLYMRGRWRMVWVDSYFPCVPAAPGSEEWRPLYARSNGDREAWLMVIEKAFAKLHGSYEALDGGQLACTLAMLTGGVAVTELLHSAPSAPARSSNELWSALGKALASGFVGAGTPLESEGLDGLVPGHAYAVQQRLEFGRERLVLLRDPWGCAGWQGRWRPGCELWDQIPQLASAARDAEAQMGVNEEGGEFWMSLEDFRSRFAMLYCCRVLRTTLQGGTWNFSLLCNEWQGARAGGCPNYRDTWHQNPRFGLQVAQTTRVMLVLAQYPLQEEGSAHWRPGEYPIGLMVLRCPGGHVQAPLKRRTVCATSKYLKASQVSLEVELSAQSEPYQVVASTFAPGQHAAFMVYVYASERVEVLTSDSHWSGDYDSNNSSGQLVVARRSRGRAPQLVAPPPAMLQKFSGSFLQLRNTLRRQLSSSSSVVAESSSAAAPEPSEM